MATFKLSDKFGFSTDIQAGPGALSRYFQSAPELVALAINLNTFINTTWDDPSVVASQSTLSFNSPVNLGTQAATLQINAGLNGTLSIFVPSTDNAPLFDPDLFGDNIPVRLDQRYISASLQADLATGLSTTTGELQFGFDGNSKVNLTYYHPFQLNPVTPPVLGSIEETLAAFAIPGDLKDIEAMIAGSIATVDSTGELKFSGTVNLLTFTNPLASASLPVVGDLKVNAGASVAVGAAFKFSGEYQIRVQRLAGTLFRLGFYRRRKKDFSVTASASASITTSLDASTLFKNFLPAISAQPMVDENELLTGGVSADRIAAIECALKNAVDRTLSIGASVELQALDENDAMFLYEVDLSAISDNGKAMIESALRGDLTALVATDHDPGPGIRILKTLIASSKTLRHSLKVNLLGIYNVLSVAELIKSGSTAWDATTGEFVLTDSENASRIDIDSKNYGANPEKLRHVLSENLLITSVYRAGAFVSGPPTSQAVHSHSELNEKTNLGQMRHNLLLGEGLGFADAATAKANLPAQVRDFGRTLVLGEVHYDDAAFTGLFFGQNGLRDIAEYDRAGRDAIEYLVQPGEPDDFRLRVVNDDRLWQQMRDNGNPASAEFKQLFPNLSNAAVQVIGTDYINIVWWADAMRKSGGQLLGMRQFLGKPGVSRDDPEFLGMKKALANHLATVAKDAEAHFGGPWGLLAMRHTAAGGRGRFMVTNPKFSLACEEPLVLAAAAR